MTGSSAAGRFFRRIADYFDSVGKSGASGFAGSHKDGPPGQRTPGTSVFAGTNTEIDAVAFGLLFVGIVVVGTLIHGLTFLLWNLLFALFFCAYAWLIFRSARWPAHQRQAFMALLLLLSVVTVAERIVALASFIVLFSLLLQSLRVKADFARKDIMSVFAVLLLCFTGYDAFAGFLETRRNAALTLQDNLRAQCSLGETGNVSCRANSVAFEVPEFWHSGGQSNFVKDLASVAQLRVFADSATDSTIAFAAFSSPPAKVMHEINNFLYVQKSFLRSHGLNKEALVPQQLMKGADVQLFAVRYEALTNPGYLAHKTEFNALILLHERRNTTWLFILDGAELSGREFLLHRIISGFR